MNPLNSKEASATVLPSLSRSSYATSTGADERILRQKMPVPRSSVRVDTTLKSNPLSFFSLERYTSRSSPEMRQKSWHSRKEPCV